MTNKQFCKILRELNGVKGLLTGKRVVILDSRKSKNGNEYQKTIGLVGEIQYTGSREFGVKFIEIDNPSSNKGLFYYGINEFNFVEDNIGGNNMKVTGNYVVAKVCFLQGCNTTTQYSFALFDKDVSVGDTVLCDTQNGYAVGKVQCLIPKEDYVGTAVTKEIICKVDFSEFEKRKENRKKKETLKKRMNEMVKENQELVLFQMLAEKNPEMKALLDEYNNVVI